MIRSRFGAFSLALVLVAAVIVGCGGRTKQVSSPRPGPGGPVLGSTHVGGVRQVLSLRFGAGVPIHIDPKGANGQDTSSASWSYSWQYDGLLIQLDSVSTATPDNFLLVLGLRNLSAESTLVRMTIVETDTAKIQQLGTNLVGSADISIHFLKAPDRDIIGDIRLYHITRSVGGVTAVSFDSVQARFLSQDGLDTPLRAGPLSVAGNPMTERHGPDGQDYHGLISFNFPGFYDILTQGPLRDPRAFVPALALSAEGPNTELTLTAPDQRHPVHRSQNLSIQWTGGVTTPDIESFSPDHGKRGSKVVIQGHNFVYMKSVQIGGVEDPNFTIVACDRIEATIPATATTGYVRVTNDAGTVASTELFVVDTVSSSSPAVRPWGTDAIAADGDPSRCPIIEILLTDIAGHQIQIRALDSGKYELPVSQLQQLISGMVEIKLTRILLREFVTPFNGSAGRVTETTQVRFILEHHATFFLES